MSLATLTKVSKIFLSPGGGAQTVLDEVNLTIQPGETLAITGTSGSGKSTLLNILGTLEKPSTGLVELFGAPVNGLDEKALARLRAEKLGFIFQLHHLLPQLSALENVLVPAIPLGRAAQPVVRDRARDLLDSVGLGAHVQKKPEQLSGGERQRVAVVRALINEPQLLLADEPTGALDANNAARLMDLLLALQKRTGVAVAMVTHDASLAARMNRTLHLSDGTFA
jgi:ABC-type lipoprotein export system ATPase subunit